MKTESKEDIMGDWNHQHILKHKDMLDKGQVSGRFFHNVNILKMYVTTCSSPINVNVTFQSIKQLILTHRPISISVFVPGMWWINAFLLVIWQRQLCFLCQLQSLFKVILL